MCHAVSEITCLLSLLSSGGLNIFIAKLVSVFLTAKLVDFLRQILFALYVLQLTLCGLNDQTFP